jgi:glycosyltransferase involved in cell wall biosynthesis
MRILHLISCFDYGGAENRVADLVTALEANGHHVVVAARRGRRCRQLPPAAVFRTALFKPVLRSYTLSRLRRVLSAEDIDVIHSHQREPTIVGALLGRSTRTPLVTTLHSQFDWDLDLEWVRPHISGLIVVSPSWARIVRGFDQDLALRTRVVPNGISSPRHTRERCAHRLFYGCRLDELHAQFLGVLIGEAFPQVAGGFDGAELLVAGDGPCLGKIARLAARVNSSLGYRAVKILGYQADISPLCAESGLVLGVGRVALEGLAQAAPTLLVNGAHLGTVVTLENLDDCAHTNFVPVRSAPPDGQRLAAQISLALLKPTRSQDRAERVCTHVRSRFGMDTVLSATESVYRTASLSKP